MQRLYVLVAGVILMAACGVPAADKDDGPAPQINVNQAPEAESVDPQGSPYLGFGTLTTEATSLVALAQSDITVFAGPDEGESTLTIPGQTILGTTTVMSVVGRPNADWFEVSLPIRPNGSTGFIKVADVATYAVGGRIIVDLSDRELTYVLGGEEVVRTEVAIGTSANPTPTGVFYVTDSVSPANPDGQWGPHALGISARSETITEYNGGDGIIGIHGTNNPNSIGKAVSLGCVRLPNEVITILRQIVPLGTPVEIRA